MENPYEPPRSATDSALVTSGDAGADIFAPDVRRRRRLRLFILAAYCATPLALLVFVVRGWASGGEWPGAPLLIVAGILAPAALLFLDHWWPIAILTTSSALQAVLMGFIYLVSHDIGRANGGTLLLVLSLAAFCSILIALRAHAKISL